VPCWCSIEREKKPFSRPDRARIARFLKKYTC
jgi:hypothetical protein